MRISDWSSDVCSSDLFFVDGWTGAVDANIASKGGAREDDGYDAPVDIPHIGGQLRGRAPDGHAHAELTPLASSTVQPVSSGAVALSVGQGRQRVVSGRSVSVRVVLSGRRIVIQPSVRYPYQNTASRT